MPIKTEMKTIYSLFTLQHDDVITVSTSHDTKSTSQSYYILELNMLSSEDRIVDKKNPAGM